MNYWDKLATALILFPYETIADTEKLEVLIDEFLPHLKSREIVLFTDSKINRDVVSRSLSSVKIYSEKDFNLFGKTKNTEVLNVFQKKYDAVILFGTLPKKASKLLKQLIVKQKIGVNSENKNMEIMLNTNSSEPSEMLNFVKNILSKIN